MSTEFSDPNSIFDLSYSSLAGCKLPFLIFEQTALEAAFPGADIRPERVEVDGRDEDVFAFYAKDNKTAIFYITNGGDEWNEKAGDYKPTFHGGSVISSNSAVTALGRYKVGQTRFADFQDAQINECDFWVDGSKFICMGSSPGAPYYGSRFIFSPPDDFKGDFKKASPEILEQAVLSQISFYVGGQKYKEENSIASAFTQADGIKQMRALIKAQKPGFLKKILKSSPAVKASTTDNSAENQQYLMALLLKDRFDTSEACKAYLALADLAVHPLNTDDVKTQIEGIFTAKPDSNSNYYLFAVSDIAEDAYRRRFLLSFDHKEEIAELNHKIGFAFSGDVAALNLPDPGEFPANKSISLPGVLERYTEVLLAAGYDFSALDTQADTLIFCITPTRNSKQVKTLRLQAQI